MITTEENKRAEFALQEIEKFYTNNTSTIDEKTANFIQRLPTMILINGIGQTMAFLLSKNGPEKHAKVFAYLKDWLRNKFPRLDTKENNATDYDFLVWLSRREVKTYILMQNEAIAIIQWLKRYARAFQEVK